MNAAPTARLLLALTGAACLIGAALSVDQAPPLVGLQRPDWVERYARLDRALPDHGDAWYLNDPATEAGDRTAYFRAQYLVTPYVLHFESDVESLFQRPRFRPVVLDFTAPTDRRVAVTISRVRQAATAAGFETEVRKLGESLFLIARP